MQVPPVTDGNLTTPTKADLRQGQAADPHPPITVYSSRRWLVAGQTNQACIVTGAISSVWKHVVERLSKELFEAFMSPEAGAKVSLCEAGVFVLQQGSYITPFEYQG